MWSTPPSSTPEPGPLAGTDGLSLHSAARLSGLMIRHHFGHRFGWRRDSAAVWITVAVATSAVLVLAWPQDRIIAVGLAVAAAAASMLMFMALIIIGLAVSLWWGPRGTVLGYFDGTATQIVHCHGARWVLDKHFAEHPGRGEATAFRKRVFTHIAAEADRHGATVAMSTRVLALCDHYLAEMPGLKVVAANRGTWYLERSPQTD